MAAYRDVLIMLFSTALYSYSVEIIVTLIRHKKKNQKRDERRTALPAKYATLCCL